MSPFTLSVEGLSACSHLDSMSDPVLSTTNARAEQTLPQLLFSVETPCNKFVPCVRLLAALQSTIDPMSQCNGYGEELYCRSLQLVGPHLQDGCRNCKL